METPSSATAAPVEPMTVVLGGERLTVSFLDGRPPEEILVRLLRVNAYPSFALALGDEVAQVALFCDRPRPWAEALHPQSHDDVMERGHTLNLSFFERWLSRQTRERQVVDPGLEERMVGLAERILREQIAARLDAALLPPPPTPEASSPSPASAPASPGSPDKP